jgi:hypothetical protein
MRVTSLEHNIILIKFDLRSLFLFVKQVYGFSGRSGKLKRNRVRITSRRATVNDFERVALNIHCGVKSAMRRTGKYRHEPGDLPNTSNDCAYTLWAGLM